MKTAEVVVLFRALVTAIRRHVADPYKLGEIEREFMQLISDGPLQLDEKAT